MPSVARNHGFYATVNKKEVLTMNQLVVVGVVGRGEGGEGGSMSGLMYRETL